MPKNKEALIRYRIIDNCLRNKYKSFPSMESLMEVMEDKLGTTFSKSTIQKDIKAMKEDQSLGYLAPIEFSRIHNGYFYSDPNYTVASVPLNEDDIGAIDFATVVLEQFKGVPIIDQYGHAVGKIMEAVNIRRALGGEYERTLIQFEQVAYQEGSHWIGLLIEAVRNRQVVTFDYTRFDADEFKSHMIHPYLLKEYRNRWYLVGMHHKYNNILTFGLDRIMNLQFSDEPFVLHKDFDADKYFQYTFGITTFGEPESVELSFSAFQGKYIKAQPIHHSQTVLVDTDIEFRISIEVIISPELKMQVLSYGPAVKVLKPASFANDIKASLKEALKNY